MKTVFISMVAGAKLRYAKRLFSAKCPVNWRGKTCFESLKLDFFSSHC